jgi:hypothetical protein
MAAIPARIQKMTTDNPYAVNATEFGRSVMSAAQTFFDGGAHLPFFGWGDPGLGKTGAVRRAAELLKCDLLVRHVADQEPTEMGGIQWERDGKMVRLSPSELPMEDNKPTILFYDEVPQAPMMNKNLLARLVLDRQIAEHRLGNKVYVCMAGNYMHNRAGTSPMPSHLQERAIHLDIVADRENWMDWAARNSIHPFVMAYHNFAPADHHVPNPDHRSTPNPRSWTRVSDIEFSSLSGQARKAAIVGTVGIEVGTRYLLQSELFKSMPDRQEIIKSPLTAPLPMDRSVLYATVSALAEIAKPNNIGAIIAYTNRLRGDEEYQALCLREAKVRNPAITSAKEYTRFAMSERGQMIS